MDVSLWGYNLVLGWHYSAGSDELVYWGVMDK